MIKYLLILFLISPIAVFSQNLSEEFDRKLDSLRLAIDPNDPNYEEKMAKAIESFKVKLDSAFNTVPEGAVIKEASGDNVADEVKREMEEANPSNVDINEMIKTLTFAYIKLANPEDAKYLDKLNSFTNLKSLIILGDKGKSKINLTDVINQLEGIEIEELLVYNCGSQISSFPENLSKLPTLINLGLSGNNISTLPENIVLPENLRLLQLDINPISSIPDIFTNYPKLYELEIQNTKVSDKNIKQLQEKYPKLRIVNK